MQFLPTSACFSHLGSLFHCSPRMEITSVPNVNTDRFQLEEHMLETLAIEHMLKEWVTVHLHHASCHPFLAI